jgi:hypothetical protein
MNLSAEQVRFYQENGHLLLERAIDEATLVTLRNTIDHYLEASREVTASNEIYDLDKSHSAAQPRVRRLKDPYLRDPVFRQLAASDAILDPVAQLLEQAVEITGPAGSISIHHVRTLHASRNNHGNTLRPLLLFSYAAVDAFPIFDSYDLDEFDARILRGEPVREGRMEALPFRLHLPRRAGTDSIYDDQESYRK